MSTILKHGDTMYADTEALIPAAMYYTATCNKMYVDHEHKFVIGITGAAVDMQKLGLSAIEYINMNPGKSELRGNQFGVDFILYANKQWWFHLDNRLSRIPDELDMLAIGSDGIELTMAIRYGHDPLAAYAILPEITTNLCTGGKIDSFNVKLLEAV